MEPLHNAKNQYDGKKRIDLRADFIFQMVQWYITEKYFTF